MKNIAITMNLIAVVFSAFGFVHAVRDNQSVLVFAFGILFVFNGILLKFNTEHENEAN